MGAMKTSIASLVVLAAMALQISSPAALEPEAKKRRIEVCFVLDTTGSMGGLIDGAKKKIWSIAGTILESNPGAEVRMGLVGYRDRGDKYVTKVYPLSDDIDTLYARLMEFQADGGGDTPESVNQALDETVRLAGWTRGKDILRSVFLVGDAPPKTEYDEKKYPEIAKTAAASGIFINTILCGSSSDTLAIWKEIAGWADGRAIQLPQDGNVAVIETPYDKELSELNRKAGETLVPYGDAKQRREVAGKQALAERASAASTADRLKYNSLSGKAVQGAGDLVRDVADGSAKIAGLNKDDLPKDLRDLNEADLTKRLGEIQTKRDAIYAEIRDLTKKRDAFIAEAKKQAAPTNADAAFDEEVLSAINAQSQRVFGS